MNKLTSLTSLTSTKHTSTLGAVFALAATLVLLAPDTAAADDDRSGWSLNLTPVLVLPKGDDRVGGGADPELKYTLDLGGAHVSVGARVGVYYAKNLLGVTVMPTVRLMVPVGPMEPYVAFGMGYGWLPKLDHEDIATMSRVGFVYRFSERFALGLEGTFQKLDNSIFRFPALGSMLAIEL